MPPAAAFSSLDSFFLVWMGKCDMGLYAWICCPLLQSLSPDPHLSPVPALWLVCSRGPLPITFWMKLGPVPYSTIEISIVQRVSFKCLYSLSSSIISRNNKQNTCLPTGRIWSILAFRKGELDVTGRSLLRQSCLQHRRPSQCQATDDWKKPKWSWYATCALYFQGRQNNIRVLAFCQQKDWKHL